MNFRETQSGSSLDSQPDLFKWRPEGESEVRPKKPDISAEDAASGVVGHLWTPGGWVKLYRNDDAQPNYKYPDNGH